MSTLPDAQDATTTQTAVTSPPTALPPSPKPTKFTIPLRSDINSTIWSSSGHKEQEDDFTDFKSFELNVVTTPARQLSARQISGHFEDEVAKSWQEDWDDEDVEDTFDVVMGKIGRMAASNAAR